MPTLVPTYTWRPPTDFAFTLPKRPSLTLEQMANNPEALSSLRDGYLEDIASLTTKLKQLEFMVRMIDTARIDTSHDIPKPGEL